MNDQPERGLDRIPDFSPTPLERRKRVWEAVFRVILLLMTLVLVVPAVAILGFLLVRAWPALSFSFIFQNPQNYMTTGGIWAPLVGTFFLVFISLAIAAPLGVLAGVYLNEYAGNNWATRLINLAVMNLAGVPSIVHALFGVGAFVLFAGMGRSVLAASCTLAVVKNLTRGLRPYGVIENVITRWNMRRCGYGTMALHKAIGIAREKGCYKVMLLTGRKDEGVLSFYENVGFERGKKTGFYMKL
jgi:GNAT superfamily N-acetyltransferase